MIPCARPVVGKPAGLLAHLLWVGLVGLLVTQGCVTEGPATSGNAPITVRGYLPTPPVSLSFIGKAGDMASEIFAVQVTDSLVQFDADLVLQPRLAESWQFSEDRKTVTFKLRRGVRWHDGEPVTAHDVVYTAQLVAEPTLENRSYGMQFAADQVTISALDDYTLEARYAEATPEVLESWRLPILPRHSASRDTVPGDGQPHRLLEGEFVRHPIGCGPFRFVSFEPDREIVLEANDDYWDGRPAIDRLVFKIIPEERTAYQALLAGDIDVLSTSPDLWRESRESDQAERLEAFVYYRLNVWQISWNQDGSNPFFDDPRVRKALLLALDRDEFNAAMMDGLGRPGATIYHPETVWAAPDVKPLPYDPEQARRLLDEAGWVDRDGDGIREKDGRPFVFNHLTPASPFKLVDHMAAWEQESWAKVGVSATIEKLEWRALQERRNTHRYEAASWSVAFSASPDLWDMLHSSARGEGWNFGGLADTEVDRLVSEGRRTFDTESRRKIYHDLQRRLQELQPAACLFHFPSPVLHDKRLQGITPSPMDYWRTTQGPRVWRWTEER